MTLRLIPGGGDAGIAVGGVVLVVVLVVGLLAGRAKGRFGLLLAGLATVVVLGVLYVGAPDLDAPNDVVAAQLGGVYAVVLPIVIAFTAGWLVARGSWFGRALVLGVAVVLVAAFPYAAAGTATAGWVG